MDLVEHEPVEQRRVEQRRRRAPRYAARNSPCTCSVQAITSSSGDVGRVVLRPRGRRSRAQTSMPATSYAAGRCATRSSGGSVGLPSKSMTNSSPSGVAQHLADVEVAVVGDRAGRRCRRARGASSRSARRAAARTGSAAPGLRRPSATRHSSRHQVQPSVASGTRSTAVTTGTQWPSRCLPLQASRSLGHRRRSRASASRRSRSGAGCGPTSGSVTHLTTTRSPTIHDSLVWSTSIRALRRAPPASAAPRVTRKPSGAAGRRTEQLEQRQRSAAGRTGAAAPAGRRRPARRRPGSRSPTSAPTARRVRARRAR